MKCIECLANSSNTKGGSTVETIAYSVSEVYPRLRLREVRPSACIHAGGVFVIKAAEEYFQRTFSNTALKLSDYEIKEFVKKATDSFEAIAKEVSNDVTRTSIDIGESRYSNAAVGIKRGRMMLDG